jgi:hypothetical protein
MMGHISIKTHVPNLFIFFAAKELGKQLEAWLSTADLTHGPARAIIAPYVPLKFLYVLPYFSLPAEFSNCIISCRHAGYQYCGACSGFAYRQISPVVV